MANQDIKSVSRLDVLMRAFDTSGKNLARAIHVDEALVSKWRRGNRLLKPGSQSADRIVEHFIDIDKDNGFAKLRKLLSAWHKDIGDASVEKMEAHLRQWLTEDTEAEGLQELFSTLQSNPNADMSISYHFSKNSGRRQAVNFFNEYARKQSEPLDIVAFTTEDGMWFYEDEQFRKDWTDSYFSILECGHIIKVIHPINRRYEQLAESLLSWLPIHLTGKTIDYYIPEYGDEQIFYTYFIIPGHLALWGSSSGNYTKTVDTWVSNDKFILKNMESTVKEYLNKSMPLLTRYFIDSGEQYLNELTGVMQRRNTRYFHTLTPLYLPMPEDLLNAILKENDIVAEDAVRIRETYIRLASLNLNGRSRYLVSLKSLRESLEADTVELRVLTHIAGAQIVVKSATYHRLVREGFRSAFEYDTVDVGLIPDDIKDDFDGINVLALENTCVHFAEIDKARPFAMVLHEMTFIVSVMERIKALWREIPAIMKSREYIEELVGEILDAGADISQG